MSAVYQLSSCIEWQFAEAGELDARLRAAKAAGFELAEFHLWREKPIEALAAKHFPGIPVLPTMSTGATDGIFLEALETDPSKYLPEIDEARLGGDVVRID